MLKFIQAIQEVRKDGKRTQAEVDYQTEPSDDQQCAGCAMYEVPGACSEVEGPITPAGWCRLFEPADEEGEVTHEAIEHDAVVKYLREQADGGMVLPPEIAALVGKQQPGAGDVHATTALGNDGKRKAKDFLSTIAELKDGAKVVAVLAVGDEGMGKRLTDPDHPLTLVERFGPGGMIDRMFGIGKADPPRHLKPKDAKSAHTPFPHDANALSNLRPDQVPRFLGALTDQDKLPTRTLSVNGLVAMQDRVDPEKVQSMRDQPPGKPPLVVRNGGRNLIADGHHRATAQWLDGAKTMDVKFMDLSAVDQAVKSAKVGSRRAAQDCPDCGAMEGEFHKAGCTAIGKSDDAEWSIPLEIIKADEDKQLVFGWASVSSVGGELVVDKQDDIITEDELEQAAYEFVLYHRSMGDMHERMGVGRLVESMMFTKEKQDALGIDLGMVGWFTGFRVDDPGVWKRIKAGELPEFSIGGKAVRSAT